MYCPTLLHIRRHLVQRDATPDQPGRVVHIIDGTPPLEPIDLTVVRFYLRGVEPWPTDEDSEYPSLNFDADDDVCGCEHAYPFLAELLCVLAKRVTKSDQAAP